MLNVSSPLPDGGGEGWQVIRLGSGAWLPLLSTSLKVEKWQGNIEMNEGADEGNRGEAHPTPTPLTPDCKFYKGKNCIYLFSHCNPTPGTVPDSQEVHNNFWWN